ncbi:2-oxo-4-hydroxy-4-carboxy-5-ureidoimidazoline decarboxylase [Streptacidiphilus sp. PB12-B1b]|uniref:2-oxo-4-hydroxy-4-carboxy-5-ureidoimidazoline decarboxylase n=1 Tax=Streptacidiphilus sp. PB12-B1b TaxID=2705012 RepID=UPI001CDC73C8|nr:2-oxo-4-hydroxy-4-carboxy-5-ureidoimidazoline decarboxylase [Streptacidiphilus sp. PB12-B1b]
MTQPDASADTALRGLNQLPDEELDSVLAEVCSSPAWTALVRATRPWADAGALHAANLAAMRRLGPDDLADAMAGHARIGAPRDGDAASRREQAGVHGADAALLAELRVANARYEEAFGHVFLICATGRTAASMLAALRERQGNDPAAEREIVRGELRKINDIRLDRLLQAN